MCRVIFTLPKYIKQKLEKIAKEKNTTQSELIRASLYLYLDKESDNK
ncbi:hypothetical protein GW835_01045 [archaeon]|nr:hypothetical protein [archaeon]NCP79140.1 hypothetical protein [archaeon]NCP97914.1 hypothetical protein [archaeon]NCQ06907.1 hypothetical protein [archaeon]NCQ50703.1 hypothetical protein [archaeon]